MHRDLDESEEHGRLDRYFHGPPLRGVVRLAVLSIIRDGPAHGGEISQTLREKYAVDVAQAVVYMLLRRMERYGLLISKWEIRESGAARRKYTITDEGLAHLEYGLERLKRLTKTIKLLTKETAKGLP